MIVIKPGFLQQFSIAVNDGKLKALGELEEDLLSRFNDRLSEDTLLGILSWILSLLGYDLDSFLESQCMKPSKEWSDRFEVSMPIKRSLIQTALQQTRARLHPCSAMYQYPGRCVIGDWVLPVGMSPDASLEAILFRGATSRKFGSKTVHLSRITEGGLLTVRDLIEKQNLLKAVDGIGDSTFSHIMASLAEVGFVRHSQKQVAGKG